MPDGNPLPLEQQQQQPEPMTDATAPPPPSFNYHREVNQEMIKSMLGYTQNHDICSCLDINFTGKEWGFTLTEFSEIIKHIQVPRPAIQRHVNQTNDIVPAACNDPIIKPSRTTKTDNLQTNSRQNNQAGLENKKPPKSLK